MTRKRSLFAALDRDRRATRSRVRAPPPISCPTARARKAGESGPPTCPSCPIPIPRPACALRHRHLRRSHQRLLRRRRRPADPRARFHRRRSARFRRFGVAIVDETARQKTFPDGDALGQRIRIGTTEREIVGICAPHRHNARRAEFPPRVFVPYAAGHDGRVFLVARYATEDADRDRGRDRAVALGAPDTRSRSAGAAASRPFSHLVEQDINVWLARIGAILFGLFGAIALTARRRRSLRRESLRGFPPHARDRHPHGDRRAAARCVRPAPETRRLANPRRRGRRTVCFRSRAGRILAQILYRVSPTDPLALGLSTILLVAAALLACFLPARRAMNVDPMTALRAE